MAPLFRTQFRACFILENGFAGRIIPRELEVNTAACFQKRVFAVTSTKSVPENPVLSHLLRGWTY